MKKIYDIAIAFLCLAVVCACSEEVPPYALTAGESGVLALKVTADAPVVKSLVQVDDYPVSIKGTDGSLVQYYETVAAVPSAIKLDAGEYSVESHTPGNISRKMSAPYYFGSKVVSIIAGNTTQADVVCTMQNTKIVVKYGEEFFDVFKTWSITVDDGSDMALAFTEKDPQTDNQTVVYWYFTEQVASVTLNFVGYTKEGNSKISQKFTIKKPQAAESYDDDNEYFAGGDALYFTFTPEEATTGKIGSISLTAKIEFAVTEDVVIVNVEDMPVYPEGPDGPDDPTPAENPITLTLPAPITLPEQDLSKGDAVIEASEGISSLIVTVVSNSGDMMDSLAGVAAEYAGVDLVSGCEVVGNTGLVNFLGSLGQAITVPAVGDLSYTFPIGNFFSFLGILPGEHNFNLTVTDKKGNTKSGTVKVTVPEE